MTASFWVQIDGLEEHWAQARIEDLLPRCSRTIRGDHENISAFTLSIPAGHVARNRRDKVKPDASC